MGATFQDSEGAIIGCSESGLDATAKDQNVTSSRQFLRYMDLWSSMVSCWLGLKSFYFHLQVSQCCTLLSEKISVVELGRASQLAWD